MSAEDKPSYSGQLRLRMPAGLHRDVAHAAFKEGVSMNQFICAVLAGAVGWTALALEEKRSAARPTGDEAFNEMWRQLLAGG